MLTQPTVMCNGDVVVITCGKRAAHDLVLGFMKGQQEGVPFSVEATRLIEALSRRLIGAGVRP